MRLKSPLLPELTSATTDQKKKKNREECFSVELKGVLILALEAFGAGEDRAS